MQIAASTYSLSANRHDGTLTILAKRGTSLMAMAMIKLSIPEPNAAAKAIANNILGIIAKYPAVA